MKWIYTIWVVGVFITVLSGNGFGGIASQQDLAEIIAPGISGVKDIIINERPSGLTADQYTDALSQIALFAKSKNEQCQLALQIITDQTPRTGAICSNIEIDGIASEWRRTLPYRQETRWPVETKDQARDVWEDGIAAVVRENVLYVMCGLKDKDYFKQPRNRLDLRIDCAKDRNLDVIIHLTCENGVFKASSEQFVSKAEDKEWPVSGPLKTFQVSVDEVVEIAVPIDQFVPVNRAKPIWNFNARVHTFNNKKRYYPQTRWFAIYDESAEAGVCAKDFLHPFVLLAADVGLAKDDLTAAAIAITSATIYSTSNEEVRLQLRKDNAKLLQFARDLDQWQKKENFNYCLSRYPLEAQLYWSNRLIWNGLRYLSWNHHKRKFYYNDMENYSWSFVDIETLYKLKELAIRNKLISSDIYETAKNIDLWVSSKLRYRTWPEEVELHKSNPESPTYGQFKGTPVYVVLARHTRSYLKAIDEKGSFYGGCPDQAWLTQDMLRSVGIAPIAFHIAPAKGQKGEHCWGGFYHPLTKTWMSFQPGRSGRNWWYLDVSRIAVFPYAVTCKRGGCKRYYAFFTKPVQGRKVKSVTQNGIPTSKIRQWMLKPVI